MSLIAWYPLKGDIKDYSGYNRHLSSNNGAVVNASGKIGKCYSFDGVNDYINLSSGLNTFLPSGNAPFSVAVWFNLAAIPSLRYDLWTWGNTAVAQLNGCDIYPDKMNFYNYSNDASFIYEPFVINKWYHFAVTYDGFTLKQYLNGVLKTTNTFGNFQIAKNTELSIGRDWGRNTSYHNGKINDFRIYDHALSEKEISEITKAKVLHYEFNDFQEPTENIWPGPLYIYNNYGVPASLTATGETYKGQPVYRLAMTVDTAHASALTNFQTELHSHGVYGGSMVWKANTKYAISIYWKPVNKPDTVFGGTASNVGGWVALPNVACDNGWFRYTRARDGSDTVDRNDAVHHSFYCPSLQLNETIYIDVCCPQTEFGKDYATEYTPSRRDGIIKDRSGFMNDAILSGDVGIEFSTSYGVAISGNTVQKTSGSVNWDAGAYSRQCFYSDCFVEYTLDYQGRTGQQSGAEMVGFSSTKTNWSFGDLIYAIYTNSMVDVLVYENGTNKGNIVTATSFPPSTVFRIEVRNNTAYYYINGVLKYTSSIAPTFPLYVNMSLHCFGYQNKITNIKTGYLPSAKVNPKWITDSKLGRGAYRFNGVNSIKTKQLFFDNTNQCHTVNAWIYPEKTIDGSWINSQLINFNSGYMIEYYTEGKSLLYLNGGTNDSYVYGPILPRNQWSMVTYVHDTASLTCKIYINGVLYASANNYAATDIPVGFAVDTSIGDNFTGRIDDIRVYATVLSDADIKSLYDSRASLDNKGNLYISNVVESYTWDEEIKSNNLVSNGDGRNKSNYNFPKLIYSPAQACFYNSTQYDTMLSQEFIPVDKKSLYKLSGEFKHIGSVASTYYYGVACFDSKKRFIEYWMVNFFANTKTTLAAALKTGDTTITLTSSANWINTNPGSLASNKFIAFWGAESEYPDYTYTRKGEQYLSISGNVITLPSPWANPEIPAGTPVANAAAGGTYSYIAAGAVASTANWVKKEASISGWSTVGDTDYSKFRYGTEYVQIMILPNYGTASTLAIRNMKFWNDTLSQNINSPADKRSITENSLLLTNRISEVGVTDRLVAWWKLNGNTKDYSGNKYDGSIIGSVTVDNGIKGLAYKFPVDATSHIKLPVQAMQNLNDFSVSCWVNFYDISLNNYIISGTNTGDNTILICLRNDNVFEVWLNNIMYTSPYTERLANKWYHVALVRDGSTLRPYIDGVALTPQPCTDAVLHVTGYLLFGQEQDGVGTAFDINQLLRGKLTDVRVYDKALSVEEINILYDMVKGSKAAKFTDKGIYIKGEIKEA